MKASRWMKAEKREDIGEKGEEEVEGNKETEAVGQERRGSSGWNWRKERK